VDLAEPGEPPFYAAADGFAQVGPALNAELRRLVRRGARADGLRVLELFAGAGNLSRDLAPAAAKLVAVERDPVGCELWQRNIGERWASAELRRGDSAEVVAALVRGGARFDLVVLDPPREGARAVVDWLTKLDPERIVYVSCDPMTLARDLGGLAKSGYRVSKLTPIDGLPQTYHLELVAVLERIKRA
jgi:23S rRNA (uracil1939-C5)-methyltransferase